MSKAVESIVRGYVLLENRRALEDLLAHRQKLLDGLSRVSGIDPDQVVTVIRDEIAIIQDGLERLDGSAAGGQGEDRVKVLRLTVSEGPAAIDKTSTHRPTGDAAGVAEQPLEPRARDADAELPAGRPTPEGEQDSTQIRVLGLAVSGVSTGAGGGSPSSAPRVRSEVSSPDPYAPMIARTDETKRE